MKYPPLGLAFSITEGGTDDMGESSSEYLMGGVRRIDDDPRLSSTSLPHY